MVVEIIIGVVSGLVVGGTLIVKLYNIFDKKIVENESSECLHHPIFNDNLAE